MNNVKVRTVGSFYIVHGSANFWLYPVCETPDPVAAFVTGVHPFSYHRTLSEAMSVAENFKNLVFDSGIYQ